ncbi:hypothetical protein CHUAL_013426 [Chamberlinius hualienensis]
MKRLETDYETKRTLLMQHYESVKYAQQVQIEDIPLPSMQMPTSTVTAKTTTPPPPPEIQTTAASHNLCSLPGDIPQLMMHQPPLSILKKTSVYEFGGLDSSGYRIERHFNRFISNNLTFIW